MKPIITSIFLGIALVGQTAIAEENGAGLYKSKTCVACHGAEGKKGLLPTYPKLNGQSKEYLVAQMKDIKSGARSNGQTAAMKGIMHLVSEDDMTSIATWLSSLQ
ncbi:MAG: hypothetical protein RIT27_1380 [Pseudomonadota bacterium]|jgi:cytochrome c